MVPEHHDDSVLVPSTVSFDDGPDFQCFIHEGEYWNGWACPFFTDSQAGVVASWLMSILPIHDMYSWLTIEYVPELDAFVTRFEQDSGDDYPNYWFATWHNGVRYYCIGSWSWTWNRAESE